MVNIESKNKSGQEIIQPLPFTYARVYDQSLAQYKYNRTGIRAAEAPSSLPQSDDTIVGLARETFEKSKWFYSEYWRKKGQPKEQIEFRVGEKTITLYNFNGEIPFTDAHMAKTANVLAEFASKFPQVIDKIDWILIDQLQPPSYYGDSVNYPSNGQTLSDWKIFQLYPRGDGVYFS